MKLIPAIDLKNRTVVYASGGDRRAYPPLKTDLFPSSEPLNVISRLQSSGGFDTFYIADLDAIMNTDSNEALIDDILKAFPKLSFWVDVGIRDQNAYSALKKKHSYTPIIPTETMRRSGLPPRKPGGKPGGKFGEKSGAHYILSLDFKAKSLLGPNDILQNAAQWPDTVIALSLDAIGGKGPDFEMLDTVFNFNLHSKIVSGGGVRHKDDLLALKKRELYATLIANALYTGKIDPQASI